MSEHQTTGSANRDERPWWASFLAAFGIALVIAGMVSGAAALVAGQPQSDNPEAALEQLVESRTAAYLASALDHAEP